MNQLRQGLPRLQRCLRHLTWVFCLAALGYLGWRYEFLTLPQDGCSPLARFTPGQTLLTDRHPQDLGPGDAVLFKHRERMLLAEVRRLRCPSLCPTPDTERLPLEQIQDLWLETDMASCPGDASPELGWIPAGDVSARVLLVWPG